MTLVRRLLPFLAIVTILGCSDAAGPGGPPPQLTSLPRQLSGSEQAVIGASNSFGFNLLQRGEHDLR